MRKEKSSDIESQRGRDESDNETDGIGKREADRETEKLRDIKT